MSFGVFRNKLKKDNDKAEKYLSEQKAQFGFKVTSNLGFWEGYLKHGKELEALLVDFEKSCKETEKTLLDGDLLEKLAELEHEQWSHWMKYQKSQKELVWLNFFKETGKPQFDSNTMERWILQSQTPYSKLTEKEKESDREWARKVLLLIKLRNVVILRKQLKSLAEKLFDHVGDEAYTISWFEEFLKKELLELGEKK